MSPGKTTGTVVTSDGRVLTPPDSWILLPPGDAGLTRRVKAGGITWTVQEKKGRKVFSRGVWAEASRVQLIQSELDAERGTVAYVKRLESAGQRREKKQAEYVEDFRGAVLHFLKFDKCFQTLAEELAEAVTNHATPVGSGTVARTQRIPVEQRAESAVIAWLRHHTTAYDNMRIERVKGRRREVRRELAGKSRELLERYRWGVPVEPGQCLLQIGLQKAIREASAGE